MGRKVQPVKVHNWRIEIDGLDTFECQTCNIPVPEIEVVEHGAGNHKQKTAGLVSVGELSFTKLKPLDGSDSWAWDWFKQVQDTKTGKGGYPQFYEKSVIVKLMGPDNETTAYAWLCDGVFIIKIEYNELSKVTSENVIETVTCSVDEINRI
jgi:hypothetical protein